MPGELPIPAEPLSRPPSSGMPVLAPDPGIVLLVALSSLQPFALNSLAPATPAMARTLGESYASIQLQIRIIQQIDLVIPGNNTESAGSCQPVNDQKYY